MSSIRKIYGYIRNIEISRIFRKENFADDEILVVLFFSLKSSIKRV